MTSVCIITVILIHLKVFEDHAARRLIKKMDVNCCNEGCNWVGNLGSLLEVINRLNNSLIQKVEQLQNTQLLGIIPCLEHG